MAASLQSSNAGSPSLKTSFNGSSTRTISYTVASGSNQVLVVKWCTDKFEAYSGATWTFNSDALTIAGTSARATVNFVQIAYLKAPDQGTFDLVLTTTDQHNLGTIIIELWQDVDQADTPVWATSENSSATSHTSGATVASGYVATTAISGNFGTTTTNGGTTDILANQATYSGKNASFGYKAAGQPGWTWTGSAQVAGGTLVLKDAAGGDVAPPVITGPGGATGATSSVSVAENTTAVHIFTADESVAWDLNGGADVAFFTINASTGALAFASAPNFESPADAGANNTYVVGVRATDAASNATTQTCTVTVTDAAEGGGGTKLLLQLMSALH